MAKFEVTNELKAAASKMVEELIEKKEVISFGNAAQHLGLIEETKQFRGSMCPQVIACVEAAREGASALLVDQNGKYATRKETENHPQFLQALGYTEIPAYKPRTARKGGGKMKMAAKILSFAKENDCSVADAIALHKLAQEL